MESSVLRILRTQSGKAVTAWLALMAMPSLIALALALGHYVSDLLLGASEPVFALPVPIERFWTLTAWLGSLSLPLFAAQALLGIVVPRCRDSWPVAKGTAPKPYVGGRRRRF